MFHYCFSFDSSSITELQSCNLSHLRFPLDLLHSCATVDFPSDASLSGVKTSQAASNGDLLPPVGRGSPLPKNCTSCCGWSGLPWLRFVISSRHWGASRNVSPSCTPVQGESCKLWWLCPVGTAMLCWGNSRSGSRVATPPPVRGASKSPASWYCHSDTITDIVAYPRSTTGRQRSTSRPRPPGTCTESPTLPGTRWDRWTTNYSMYR